MSSDQSRTAPIVWLDRRTAPHAVTLVLLTGISSLSMSVLLPSLPSLAAHFNADFGIVALAVSAYLGLTAVLQLLFGPLSDRYGRRPVLLISYALFLVATVGCMFARTIEVFLLFRMMQAAVAAGFALSRAVVRDMAPPAQAASVIGYITMGMSLVPMLGPMLGGWLDETFGWQSVFVFTFVSGALVLALMVFDLGETNMTPSASFAAQFATYPELLGSQHFWGYALTAAVASGAYYALLGGGSWVATHLLGMGPTAVGLSFGFVSAGYLVGNYLSGRFSVSMGINRMMLVGSLVSACGMIIAILLFAFDIVTAASFFGPTVLVGAGNGLLLPNANAGLVSVQPHLAGSASGLGGAMMIGMGSILSVFVGLMLGPETGAWPLLGTMLATAVLAVITSLRVMRLPPVLAL